MQRSVEPAVQRCELFERGIRSRGIEQGADAALQGLIECIPHGLDLKANRRRDVDGQPAPVQPDEQLAEPGHRSAPCRDRTVAARPPQRDHHLAPSLFRNHDRVEPAAAQVQGDAT